MLEKMNVVANVVGLACSIFLTIAFAVDADPSIGGVIVASIVFFLLGYSITAFLMFAAIAATGILIILIPFIILSGIIMLFI